MSPINAFGILAFASAALAVPHAHDSHQHLHRHEARAPAPQGTWGDAPPAYGAPPYPIPSSSGASVSAFPTGGYGTGYLRPTGYYGWPASSAVSSSSEEATTTAVETVIVSPSASPVSPIANEQCTADTTITTQITLTMTVTASGGGYPTSSPASPVAPVTTSSASSAVSPPAYSAPAPSAASPPAYSAPTSSPASPSAYSAPAAASGAPQAKNEAPSSPATGFSGGKRGLAYNDASLVEPFIGLPNIGFAYNWVSGSAGLASGIPYIPELHDMTETFTSVWQEQAQAAVDAGSQYIFAFNEPDIPSQANLSPEAAAAGWMQYIEPFASQGVKLVAPAVSNSAEPGQGLEWLASFFSACSECTIDAINLHWYDYSSNDISSLQNQITQGSAQSNNLPVFIGEFGFIGSDSDISSALEQAMPWLDSQDSVLGYAYYYLDDGLLLDGVVPSTYGLTFLG